MKLRIAYGLVLIFGLVAITASAAFENRRYQPGYGIPAKPRAAQFVPAHEHRIIDEPDKPGVPRAWGIIEAQSSQGWYGVQLESRMCTALDLERIPNETSVVAEGPCGLKAGEGVFLRHNHDSGRWSILFKAEKVERSGMYLQPVPSPHAPAIPDDSELPREGDA